MRRMLCSMAALLLAAGAAAPARAGQDAPPSGLLHAASEKEIADYRSDYSLAGGEALEHAAARFEQQYPQSELRASLFAKAMLAFQQENNGAGMLRMGERVLALDPNHALALILTATVLADSLGPGDPDRDKKIAEIKKNVARAQGTIDSDFIAPAAATAGQEAVYKTTLRAMAYSVLGVTNLKMGDYARAEKNLKIAANLTIIHPDPYIWYHLALAEDHRRRYPAALNSVEQALQLASSNPYLQQMAETEHRRLARLARGLKEPPASEGAPPPQ